MTSFSAVGLLGSRWRPRLREVTGSCSSITCCRPTRGATSTSCAGRASDGSLRQILAKEANAMKTASTAKMAAQFHEYLEASRKQPVLITRNGKPVAVLLAIHDKAEAEQLAGRSRSLRCIFEQAHEQIRKEGVIPHDEFWRQ